MIALHSRNHLNLLHHRKQNKIINSFTLRQPNLMKSPTLPTIILNQRRLMHTLSQSTSCKILQNLIASILSISRLNSSPISQKLLCMSSSRKEIMMQKLRKKLSESHKRSGNLRWKHKIMNFTDLPRFKILPTEIEWVETLESVIFFDPEREKSSVIQ
jgi:hypothetical protein